MQKNEVNQDNLSEYSLDSKFFEWIIYKGIKSDIESKIFAKQVVFIFSVGFLFYILNAIKWFSLGCNGLALSMLILAIITIFLLLAIKFSEYYKACGHIMLACLVWHFSFLLYSTGGISSSALTWMVSIPIFSSSLCGSRAAFFWTPVTLIVLASFIYLEATNFPLPKLNLSENAIIRCHIANTFGPIVVVLICSWFGNNQMEKALKAQKQSTIEQETINERLENLFENIRHTGETLQEAADVLNKTSGTLETQSTDMRQQNDQANDATQKTVESIKNMAKDAGVISQQVNTL